MLVVVVVAIEVAQGTKKKTRKKVSWRIRGGVSVLSSNKKLAAQRHTF